MKFQSLLIFLAKNRFEKKKIEISCKLSPVKEKLNEISKSINFSGKKSV